MEFTGLKCNGCGSTNVRFDEKNRLLICYQCGKEEAFSRHDFANNEKIVMIKDNAMKFFLDGKIDDAHKYAQDVLNIMLDNIPALYMMAYYDELVCKRIGALKSFFAQAAQIKDVDYHEIRDMLKLFGATARYLLDYESEMLTFVALNMQSDEDKKELCEFVDKMCPYFIVKRSSIDYFVKNAELYADFAEHCGIPKTVYALIKAIIEVPNPDSPYKDNQFDNHERNQYFYNNYVLPVGKIVTVMNISEMRDKFLAYYSKVKDKYAKEVL